MSARSYGDPSYAIFAGERRKMHQDKYYRPTLKQQGYFPVRYRIILLAFLGMVCSTLLISNVHLTMPYMAFGGNVTNQTVDVCNGNSSNGTGSQQDVPFDWDVSIQDSVIGSFFLGYFLVALPGGRLSELLRPGLMIGIAMSLSSVLTLLSPVTAELSYIALIILRAVMGLLLGVIYPSTINIIANWSPPHERSTITSIIWAGVPTGLAISYGITDPIASGISWDAVFYIEGGLVLLWSVVSVLLHIDTPEDCAYITKAERIYLATTIGEHKDAQSPPIPVKSLLKSLSVWAACTSMVASIWGLHTLLFNIPDYLSSMLQLSQHKSVVVMIMGQMLAVIISLVSGVVVDHIIHQGTISMCASRKLTNAIGHLGTGICLVIIPYVECDADAAVTLVILAMGFQGLTPSGHIANLVDLAPNYAGTLAGMAMTLSIMSGVLAPLTSTLLTDDMTFDQWSNVFYVTFGVYLADLLFFAAFSSGVVQSWNQRAPPEQDDSQWVMTSFRAEDNLNGELVVNKKIPRAVYRSSSYGGRQVMDNFKRSFVKPSRTENYH